MKTSSKVIRTTTDVLVVGTGVVTGVFVAVAMAGIATSIVGKVLGGMFTYVVVSGITTKACEDITEPVVNLLIEKETE